MYTYLHSLPPPPPPPPIEPGGIYARSPSPEPPYLGKRIYPLSRVLVTIGNYNKTPLSELSREIFPETKAQKYPFQRKWEYACGPSCIRVGEGGFTIPTAKLPHLLTYSDNVSLITQHCFLLNTYTDSLLLSLTFKHLITRFTDYIQILVVHRLGMYRFYGYNLVA